ncbi:hypothetical protein VTN31DRAFT_5466 [Thermomyces dupontii]|uniref:uncharacterized protein n=1 Tax=Talaromyces thermophilus TaxID=28565 RepID=UPI0037446FB9
MATSLRISSHNEPPPQTPPPQTRRPQRPSQQPVASEQYAGGYDRKLRMNGGMGASHSSHWYRQWIPRGPRQYAIRTPQELHLPRPVLHRWLAMSTSHGDFKSYHVRFRHQDARLTCSCGRSKSPEHLVLCRRARRSFGRWPSRPSRPPTTGQKL